MVKVEKFSLEEFTPEVTARGNKLLDLIYNSLGEENIRCCMNGDIYFLSRSLRYTPLMFLTLKKRILVAHMSYLGHAIDIAKEYEKLFPGEEFTIEKNW